MKEVMAIIALFTLFVFALPASGIERGGQLFYTESGDGNGFYISVRDINRIREQTSTESLNSKMDTLGAPIGRIEYFINSDPGFGNGTPLDFTVDNGDAHVNEMIDVSQFDEGFNFLYVRSSNISGLWGMTLKRAFFLKKGSKAGIKTLEYYFTDENGFTTQTFYYQLENGEESFTFNPNVTELSFTHDYTMHIWAIDSIDRRSFEASMDFTYEQTVGISDIKINRNFIYPNPASDVIHLKLDNNLLENSKQYQIISMDGRIFMQAALNTQNDVTVNVDHLPKGKYFVQLVGENIYSGSFIKQ